MSGKILKFDIDDDNCIAVTLSNSGRISLSDIAAATIGSLEDVCWSDNQPENTADNIPVTVSNVNTIAETWNDIEPLQESGSDDLIKQEQDSASRDLQVGGVLRPWETEYTASRLDNTTRAVNVLQSQQVVSPPQAKPPPSYQEHIKRQYDGTEEEKENRFNKRFKADQNPRRSHDISQQISSFYQNARNSTLGCPARQDQFNYPALSNIIKVEPLTPQVKPQPLQKALINLYQPWSSVGNIPDINIINQTVSSQSPAQTSQHFFSSPKPAPNLTFIKGTSHQLQNQLGNEGPSLGMATHFESPGMKSRNQGLAQLRKEGQLFVPGIVSSGIESRNQLHTPLGKLVSSFEGSGMESRNQLQTQRGNVVSSFEGSGMESKNQHQTPVGKLVSSFEGSDMESRNQFQTPLTQFVSGFEGSSIESRIQLQTPLKTLVSSFEGSGMESRNQLQTPLKTLVSSFEGSGMESRNQQHTPLGKAGPLIVPSFESPGMDSRMNDSLGLLGSPQVESPLSQNPYFSDLKALLSTECKRETVPQSLFSMQTKEPSPEKQPESVFSREQKLHERFNNLQPRNPDEVRQMSNFFRYQTALIETERFKTLHECKYPGTYKDSINTHFDNKLHQVMDRVEKSVELLEKSNSETKAMRVAKSRPHLRREAVILMEEWYAQNLDHPYPTAGTVEYLARLGNAGVEQVKKWFANKRNRNQNTRTLTEIAMKKRKLGQLTNS